MKKLLFLFACLVSSVAFAADEPIVIPLGGNAWVNGSALITDDGLMQWTSSKSTADIYFRVPSAQQLGLALRLRVPSGKSRISITVGKTVFTKDISNTEFDTIAIGNITVADAGHVKVSLKGISRTGLAYAQVSDLLLTGAKDAKQFTYVRVGSSYHFGRRGPSVHLRYDVPSDIKKQVKWFYNEISVPEKMDVIGSYFMADGFSGGYFGMQVNSPTERRILFSVWSPFNTDDPKSIPDSLKVKLLKKGATVHGGEFGDEGSGGQSYMLYPWQAGKTYAFLLRAEPDKATKHTTFTAWFKDVAAGKWLLVASFSRPQTDTYLTSLYSFLENFEPDSGNQVRLANFKNQWLGDSSNNWHESTGALYTGDATAKTNYRKDYAGGSNGNMFFLKNGGFFNELVPLSTNFKRTGGGPAPVIDLDALPME
ncbi:DUF3472 domain-containing protein [Mucilaginibacter pedocola]|uniref:DUF5077 domain-containing protein n=1 Tax=Mucilaginibacter pedocola TaxID=1792845 RepID=A0A1S9P9C0_9SPHI|nr:DUF3472 domain-containing protein [Mucilaginibacter pedocola]OOQ57555.1 hypothetical protein BC343_12165 [Mucilaginibacter pedocola]